MIENACLHTSLYAIGISLVPELIPHGLKPFTVTPHMLLQQKPLPMFTHHATLTRLTAAFGSTLIYLTGVAAASPFLSTPAVTAAPLAQQPNCNNAQTQIDMSMCAGMSYQAADRALNRTYQTLVPKLSTARRQKLTDAQLKWIKFRDAECEFYGSEAEGGTMQPMLVSGCKDQVTQQRTSDFNAYLIGKSPASSGNYKTADQRLNQRYQQLLQRLEPNRKQKLETAELAWIAFRDSACGFEASGGGNAARNQCLTRLTLQRNQQLQGYLAIDR